MDAGPDELAFEIDLDGPDPQTVFDFLIEPARLARWWAPQAEINARPGGEYVMSWPDQGWHLRGEYTDFDRPVRLAFSWRWDHEPDLPTRHVTVMLRERVGGTGLRLIQGPYGASNIERADRESHRQGWLHFLDRLAGAVAEDSSPDN